MIPCTHAHTHKRMHATNHTHTNTRYNRLVHRNTTKHMHSLEFHILEAWTHWHATHKHHRAQVILKLRHLSRLSEAAIRQDVLAAWRRVVAVRRVLARRQGTVVMRLRLIMQRACAHAWYQHLRNVRHLVSCTQARRVRSLQGWLEKWLRAARVARGRRKVLHVLWRRRRREQKRRLFSVWSDTRAAHIRQLNYHSACIRSETVHVIKEWRLATSDCVHARHVRSRLVLSAGRLRQRQFVLCNFAHWCGVAHSEHVQGVAVLRMVSRRNVTRYRSTLLLWGFCVNHRRRKRRLQMLLFCETDARVHARVHARGRLTHKGRAFLHTVLSEWRRHLVDVRKCRALFHVCLKRQRRRMLADSMQRWYACMSV